MTIEELNAWNDVGVVKFVEIDHDRIIFAVTDMIGNPKHVNMVSSEDLEKVTGAGTIFMFADYWKLEERGSNSISYKINRLVGCSKELEIKLEFLIKKEYRKEYIVL